MIEEATKPASIEYVVRGMTMTVAANYRGDALSVQNAAAWVDRVVDRLPQVVPGCLAGRGVVICAGGLRYLTCAWVCINMLRRAGCTLPVELWHLGEAEVPPSATELFRPLGVTTVDAETLRPERPARILNGWELKPYAIMNSSFAEVLFLDADNVPIADPTYLFDSAEYRSTGAIFWPDYGRLAPDREIWGLIGTEYRDEPEFESGQIVVDKRRCWRALSLTMSLNEYSDFWYRFIHGDKETFHISWRRLQQAYSMPERGIAPLDGAMCQHDFAGRRVFQHRNLRKWTLDGNARIPGFLREDECIEYLDALRPQVGQLLGAHAPKLRGSSEGGPSLRTRRDESDATDELTRGAWLYRRIGHDERLMTFGFAGRLAAGQGVLEQSWRIVGEDHRTILELSSNDGPICRLTRGPDHVWRGRWLRFERMAIELVPIALQEPSPVPSRRDGPRLLTRMKPVLAEMFPAGVVGRVLQLGAGSEAWDDLIQHVTSASWEVAVVDPMIGEPQGLWSERQGQPKTNVIRAAVTDIDGIGTLWRSEPAGCGECELGATRENGDCHEGDDPAAAIARYSHEQAVRMIAVESLLRMLHPKAWDIAIIHLTRMNERIVTKFLEMEWLPSILIVVDGVLTRCDATLRSKSYRRLYTDGSYQIWKREDQ